MRYTAAVVAMWTVTLPMLASASQPQFLDQGFLFDWNPTGTTVPIPVTEQCDTIHIEWSRSTATGPSPTAPYYLQVFTSTFIVPFIIDAGSGQSFDWDVPFTPNTQYQICMFDSQGVTGGCQAIYTVIPNSNSSNPSCTNVTFPAGAMDVEGEVFNGALSQYGWVPQCTDIAVTPKNGTPPYTFEIAPSSHPPVNITSNTMDTMNWTVDLSYGSSFFITVGDSKGNRWSQGPIHSGSNDDTACLDLNASDEPMVTRTTAVGAGVGGALAGLLLGALLAFLLFARSAHNSGHSINPFSNKFTSVPRYSMSEDAQTHYDDLGRVVSGSGDILSSGHTRTPTMPSMSRQASDTPLVTPYMVEPFIMPDSRATSPPTLSTATPFSSTNTRGQTSSSGHPDSTTSPSSDFRREGGSAGAAIGEEFPGTPQHPRGNSHVYVVHHDGGRAPVTVYTDDGAEVVELPPRYIDERTAGGSGRAAGDGHPAERPRQPGSVPRKPRGGRMESGMASRS